MWLKRIYLIVACLVFCGSVTARAATMESETYRIPNLTMPSGGEIMDAGSNRIRDIKGQAVIGRATSETYVGEFGGMYTVSGTEETQVPYGTVQLRIERADNKIKVSWSGPTPDIYVLQSMEKGSYSDTDLTGWSVSPVDLRSSPFELHASEGYFYHLGEHGEGYTEVFYKGLVAGQPRTRLADALAVGKVNFSLDPGYNLVSLPLAPDVNDLDVVIGTQLGAGDSDTADVIFGDVDGWKQAFLNMDTRLWQGSLPTYGIEPDKGYWIRNRTGGVETLTIVGNVSNAERTIALYSGWNLVGTTYPRYATLVEAAIASGYGGPLAGGDAQSGDRIFADISGWKQCYLQTDNTTFSGSLMDSALGSDAGSLSPQRGYWIQIRQSGGPWVWTYPKPY